MSTCLKRSFQHFSLIFHVCTQIMKFRDSYQNPRLTSAFPWPSVLLARHKLLHSSWPASHTVLSHTSWLVRHTAERRAMPFRIFWNGHFSRPLSYLRYLMLRQYVFHNSMLSWIRETYAVSYGMCAHLIDVGSHQFHWRCVQKCLIIWRRMSSSSVKNIMPLQQTEG